MGALQNEGSDRIFLNTFKGHFTKKANAETSGAVERINKNGKTVFELKFDTLKDVIIQEFERRHSDEYGYSWNIKLAHAESDEVYTLTLPYSGRITMGLFLRLPNMDINRPLTMKLYYFEEEDKTALVVYQEGDKIEAFWTKDDPQGLPQLVQTEKNGKTEWDSEARMAFLEKYLKDDVIPKMNDITAGESDMNQDTQESAAAQPQSEASDVEYVEESKSWKKKFEDDVYYECSETGVFNRDQGGKMIPALPFQWTSL